MYLLDRLRARINEMDYSRKAAISIIGRLISRQLKSARTNKREGCSLGWVRAATFNSNQLLRYVTSHD